MRPFAFFSFFSGSSKSKPITNKRRPSLEQLEDRSVPSCNTISGFVYEDVNNNGLFDAGESPIANSKIQLKNEQGVVVANATTDANGYYEFTHDQTVNQTPQTLTKEVIFPQTQTNFDLNGLLDQFDPELGELQSVEISFEGTIISTIKAENTSPTSTSNITGKVGGTLKITTPAGEQSITVEENAGNYSAGIYDGTTDFGGTSGNNFGTKEASGNKSVTLTGGDMNAFKGTGKVNVRAQVEASSYATGGGNLVVDLQSSAKAKVTVKYKYVPSPCLAPGNYTIIQNPQPEGFNDGKESSNGVVLNTPPGVDSIPVTLNGQDLPNNNFGELLIPAKISGHVFEDADDDGKFDVGEQPIANVTLTLTGTDDRGTPVTKTAQTDASGFYEFTNLRAGTYKVVETQPQNYLDGKESVGTRGGTISANDEISAIVLQAGQEGINYDFGEIKPASLSGHVYHDANDNGVRDPGEAPIAGVKVTVSGSTPTGVLAADTVTDANGFYEFKVLPAGTYKLTETQPVGWKDGKDKAGSVGGQVGDDVISNIVLGMGVAGVDYDFGEKEPDESDLQIVKTTDQSNVLVGSLVNYKLTVTNNGPGAAVDVRVVDNLPPGVKLVDFKGEGWTFANENGLILAARPVMAKGETSVIYVTIQAPLAEGTLVNTTTVTSTTPDKDPSNNKSTVTTTVYNNPGNPFTIPVRPLGGPVIQSKVDLLIGPGAPGPDTNAVFVDATFRTLLARPATIEEINTLAAQLDAGASRAQIVAGIWQSDAHRLAQANDLYLAYLDRNASAAEQAALANLLKTQSETDVIISLLTSDEYLNTHPGTNNLVAGLHADIFGRLPDTATLVLSAQSMTNSTLDAVARNMLVSDQGVANLINQAYHLTLRRAPTALEIGYCTAQMKAGWTQGDLIQRLLGSDEFNLLALNAARLV